MYKSIDELVERIDERNSDGKISTLIGVSIDKCFINSVANINGTDLTKYKIIRRDDFAVSLMQVSRDSKIPIARLKDYDQAIMSPAYPIFRVRDTSVILPEYLEMWFMRPEFDREAAFIAVGGVRGSMPWEEFAKMRLPVPSLEKQHQVVRAYQIVADRIAIKRRINDNLEATGSTLYRQVFESFGDTLPIGWRIHHLSEYLPVITGKKDANTTSPDGQYPFFSCSQDILWTKEYSFEADAILVAGNGDFNVKNYSGKFEAYQRTYVLIPKNELFCGWLYYVVKHHLPKATTAARGSVISFITKGILENIAFAVPDDFDELRLFCEKANAIVKAIRVNNSEILELQRIQLIVLEQLSR